MISEYKTATDEAIVHGELQLERELIEMNFAHKTGQLENTAAITLARKNIARLRTAQRQREIAQGLSKNALRFLHRSTFKATASSGAERGSSTRRGGRS